MLARANCLGRRETITLTTENWIDIVGHTATWVSVLIVYFTLREMSVQRKQSYKPHIIILRRYFFGYNKKYGEYFIPDLWSGSQLRKEQISQIERSEVYLEAINVGLGAAKEIDLEWKFDHNKTIKEINGIYSSKSIPISLDLSMSGLLTLNIKDTYTSMLMLSNNLKDSHDYLSPVSIDKEKLRIKIPWAIQIIMSLWVHALLSLSQEEISSHDWNKKEFELIIKYKDIGEVIHTTLFKVAMNLIVLQRALEEGIEAFSFEMEPTKVSKNQFQQIAFGLYKQ